MGLVFQGYTNPVAGHRSKANQILRELKEWKGETFASPYLIAHTYLGLGNRDKFFEWIDEALDERSAYLMYLKTDPIFDSMRNAARLKKLLRKVGLHQATKH